MKSIQCFCIINVGNNIKKANSIENSIDKNISYARSGYTHEEQCSDARRAELQSSGTKEFPSAPPIYYE